MKKEKNCSSKLLFCCCGSCRKKRKIHSANGVFIVKKICLHCKKEIKKTDEKQGAYHSECRYKRYQK